MAIYFEKFKLIYSNLRNHEREEREEVNIKHLFTSYVCIRYVKYECDISKI